MTERFIRELIASGYVRAPLKADDTESQEARHLRKEVLATRLIDDMRSLENWHTVTEHAGMEISNDRAVCGETSLKFTSPTRIGHYELAKYRIISQPKVVRRIDREDWRDWNRISVWIYPDMPGFHSIVLRVQLMNDGEHKVPDRYEREAQHNMNLKPNQWNHMTVEIPYVYRDCVTGLSFEYDMCGHEPKGTETACWYIDKLEIQKVDSDKYVGWQPGEGRIAYSHAGYQAGSKKTAIASGLNAHTFKLLETETGKVILEKPIREITTTTGTFQLMDFSEITERGRYLIMAGKVSTRVFGIGDGVWETSVWKLLNFCLTQRCGYAIPTLHDACHADSVVRHPDGRFVVANGGWHDAADMSQNATTTSQTTYALFQLARRVGRESGILYKRLIEEGKWGLDWLLKTRFGDGYRVLSCGTSCWTNGIHGDQDDIEAEAENVPIENMMTAGAAAIASVLLKDTEPEKSAYALKCAKEDWQFGYDRKDAEKFITKGDPARIVSPLLAYSTAAWSAVEIYRACGDKYYADKAVECAAYVLACQQTEYPKWDKPVAGFFWRDKERSLIQHYNHRSHESEPLMALAFLMEEFPNHPDYIKWYGAMTLYANYLRFGASLTAPYEMAAASIYHAEEPTANKEVFAKQQPHFNEDMHKDFRAQVEDGYKLHEGYYFRRFPVWFSFRGNTSPVLSSGKAAAICGKALNDYETAELAQRQMEWIIGRNPYSQSTMYGEGYNFSQLYVQLPGEQVGELSVGIESWENADEPFWPQVNTATYKEVWMHSALRWIWIAADAIGPATVDAYLKYAPGEKLCFKNTLSGQVYSHEPEYKTGKVSCEIPAGRYEVSYNGVTVGKTLIASKHYEWDSLISCVAEYKTEEDKITISVSGGCDESDITLLAKAYNISFDQMEQTVKTGETAVFTGHREDDSKPWVALFVPNGDINAAAEVYSRALL